MPILEHHIHAHELGEIPRTHPLHHPRSMIFHRAEADAQALRNFLIGQSGYREVEDFALSRRQTF